MGHYISNRLVGNASGLNTKCHAAWVKAGVTSTPCCSPSAKKTRWLLSKCKLQRRLWIAGYVTSGEGNNGYYFGIRRVPLLHGHDKGSAYLQTHLQWLWQLLGPDFIWRGGSQ